ncbi:hypothetical protein BDQ17DRAFT_1385834 [Cyathus striatus]|nr:hypothetical protein BDQ17DRAFT_1385834 [Cyathus striatus]
MDESHSTPCPPGFEAYNLEYPKQQQQQQNLDFFFQTPADILAPHPDLFESDIDSNLAAFGDQLQLLTVDSNDAYSILRADHLGPCGPLSTITVSSESAYDSLSTRSESYYNHPTSPHPSSNYSFPLDLEMDFQRVRVESEYSATHPSALSLMDDSIDPTSFGPLPPTPPRSPHVPMTSHKPYEKSFPRSSYSDYGPPRRSSMSQQDYYQIGFSAPAMGPTVSPLHVSPQLSTVPVQQQAQIGEEYKGDPRKKYKCPSCPRAFARAYNLKTHMSTHDPNRLKPHVCPHASCARSFSRKHDLGRHLVSIHRDDSILSSHHSVSSVSTKNNVIGVENGPRRWCESCGKSWVGRATPCSCHDVK